MIIDIDHFEDLDVFKKTTGDMLKALADSRLQPGADHIYVAGEKEYKIQLERNETGVPLSEATQLQLLQMIEEMHLNSEDYGIEWTVEYTGSVDSQGW